MKNNTRLALCCSAVAVALALVACGKSKVDEEKTAELIQPVARVELAGATASSASAASPAGPRSGEQIVQQVCGACHATGLSGAPKIGDKAAWAPRLAQGKDVLYKSALNGKNVMPARGGVPSLSDVEVKSAVDFLAAQAK